MAIRCPVCQTPVAEPGAACPRCHADLSLLSGFTNDTRMLLEKADGLRRDGQLAPAVQAYLEVLQIDPLNVEARTALGPVLYALRSPNFRGGHLAPLLIGAVIAIIGVAVGYWLAR